MIKPVLMCIEFFTILGIISNYLECYVAARIQAVNEALRCNLFMLSITGFLISSVYLSFYISLQIFLF